MTLISVVAPIRNEGPGVDRFVRRLTEVLGATGFAYELVLVDDGSTDDSWDRLADRAALDPRVRGLRLSRRSGREAALLAGLEYAAGDAVVVIDAGLRHPPAAILARVERWEAGADVVEAVERNRPGRGPLSRAFARLVKADPLAAADFRLVSRAALDALLSRPDHAPFPRGTSGWNGFRRDTVEVDIDHREGGPARPGGREQAPGRPRYLVVEQSFALRDTRAQWDTRAQLDTRALLRPGIQMDGGASPGPGAVFDAKALLDMKAVLEVGVEL